MIISLIAAVGANDVIGADGDLPWHLPDDMKFFSRTTKGHHVLMGRKNFESIPDRFRPLPGRPNLVVTRNPDYTYPDAQVVHSIEDGITLAAQAGEEELFIIGGGEIYRQTMDQADKLYITHVDAEPEGETHFPSIDQTEWDRTLVSHHEKDDVHNFSFTIYVYTRKESN